MKQHLEPLAHASCIKQGTHTQLDEVLLSWGSLIVEYEALILEDPMFAIQIQAIIDSIEKCWKNTDQEACILSVILHPLYKMASFSKTNQDLT